MRRGLLILGALGMVALAVGWNALFLGPRARQRSEVAEQVATARSQGETLRASLAQLRALSADELEDELARVGRLVPAEPDLDGLIRTMNDLAAKAQVEWSSLVPAPPVPGPAGGPATIGLSIKVDGTFFQVLDYLKGLENLERLVVVDAIDLAAGGGTGGAPKLSVNLRARTFAASAGASAPAPATIAAPAPVPAVPAPAGGH